MGRPRNADRPEPIRPRIVAAATALFARHGYAGTSLAAIAEAADLKAPSILYHFGSKEGLYTAVVRAFYDELRASWDDALEDGAGPGNVVQLLRGLRELDETRRDLLVTIVTELLRDGRAAEVIERAVVPVVERVVTSLDAAAEAPRPTRQIVSLLIVAYVMSLDARRSMPAVDRLRRALWGDGDHLDELALRLLRAD